ncbi:hypothetical protein EK904_000893, partial [Melospiza melodia maxima]
KYCQLPENGSGNGLWLVHGPTPLTRAALLGPRNGQWDSLFCKYEGRQRYFKRGKWFENAAALAALSCLLHNRMLLLLIRLKGLRASSEVPKLRKDEQKARNALLADIQQGTRLRKVTQINDRSAPQIEKPKGANRDGGNPAVDKGGSQQPLGGLFAGGFPVLRPAGQRDMTEAEEQGGGSKVSQQVVI